MYRSFWKRKIDFILSLCFLIFLLPLIIFIWAILCLANYRNGFYLQKRIGRKNKTFQVIKFKTMSDKKDITGKLLPDSKRLNKTGKIIRSLSLDELPQLINVLKGDMSLVGPRPLLTEYLPLYNAHQARRHEVRPGITGWAQVNGRNNLTSEEKFEMDVCYVDNVSYTLDMKILFLTIIKVH